MAETVDTQATGSEEAIIVLSEEAAAKVREFMAEDDSADSVLRVSVLPGGCSGFEYGLNLDQNTRDDDILFEVRGVRVAVDPFSAQYLEGVRIDYESTFQGSGFTFDNPNATGSCGCGTSFSA
ncbi:MAG: iron-sulfur cluster insertion protein ErpA [Gemmatimonadota bacterium]